MIRHKQVTAHIRVHTFMTSANNRKFGDSAHPPFTKKMIDSTVCLLF